MAELSGFFNALNVNGVYDRKYNANDYSENLAVIISNGVLRSANDDLRVTANGMIATVAAGRAWINGRWYRNTAPLSFTAATPPAGGSRYDRIVLRYDNNVAGRKIFLRYVQGVAADNPAKPEPVRSGDIYEIVLADIFVGTNATSVSITDTRADETVCGWIYSTVGNGAFFATLDNEFHDWFKETRDTVASVTLFKRYNWRTVLETAEAIVQFDIPQWNEETAFLEVYVNGILDVEGVDYTRSGSNLTFADTLVAGTEIEVKVYKSIDGTGIESVAGEITQLQNAVAGLQKDTAANYICNGLNDNVGISQMAQAFLDGTGAFANAAADAQLTIKAFGTFGATAAFGGSGTSASPYTWFNIGRTTSSAKRVVVDFAGCDKISIAPPANTVNTIFSGNDCHVKNANVLVSGADSEVSVQFFDGDGDVSAEGCRFTANVLGFAVIAYAGHFRDCEGLLMAGGNAMCFYGAINRNAIIIDGGKYRAYSNNADKISAVVYGGGADTSAVVVMNGVNCPTVAFSGYYQNHAVNYSGGYISGFGNITALTVYIAATTKSTFTATIPVNRP